jgi:HlyD family secretion protein
MAGPNKLFSKEALERSLSPDNLERLMPVVGAKDWLMIAAAAALFALFGAWALLGSVPTIANGRGVILLPRQIVQTQTVAGGRIVAFHGRAGDRIHEGDLLVTLDQSELLERLDQDRRSLAGLEDQDRRQSAAETAQLEAQTRQDTMERSGIEAQRVTLRKSLADATSMKPFLETRAEANRALVKEGLLGFASHDVTDSEAGVRDNDAKIYDFNSRLDQFDAQLQQIETRVSTLSRQFLEASTGRRNEIDTIRRNIELGEFQIHKDGNVYSQYSGRVAEVFAAVGQVMPAGGRLLTLEADEPGSALISISYLPVRDGKKIQPGMRIQITPDTVERERYGGIVGTVSSVSPVPVTKEGATGIIGNTELVQSLMPDGAYIEVRARLETDPSNFSGYRWSSSRGPEIEITSGLTHSTRVTIEGRAPVTYFLPILREAAGVY